MGVGSEHLHWAHLKTVKHLTTQCTCKPVPHKCYCPAALYTGDHPWHRESEFIIVVSRKPGWSETRLYKPHLHDHLSTLLSRIRLNVLLSGCVYTKHFEEALFAFWSHFRRSWRKMDYDLPSPYSHCTLKWKKELAPVPHKCYFPWEQLCILGIIHDTERENW